MKKTSFCQKITLFIFGTFLTFVLLEIGLRIAGGVVLYLQERHNHLTSNPNEYRILCLGESTTALGGEDSYPSQLEEILNRKAPNKKFSVINKGIISTTSNYILEHADRNLDRYKPRMVIVMMGINDKAYLHEFNKNLWLENIKSTLKDLRVYKLINLISQHLTHRTKEVNATVHKLDSNVPDEGNNQVVEEYLKTLLAQSFSRFIEHLSASKQYLQKQQLAAARQEGQYAKQSIVAASLACIQLAQRYRVRGLFQKAQNMLDQANALNPDCPEYYQENGELFLAQGKNDLALKAFQTALSLEPQNRNDLLGLAHAYYQAQSDEAFIIYAGYLQIYPQDYWGYIELAQWLIKSKHEAQAEEYLKRAISVKPDFDQAYVDLGELYKTQGKIDLAQVYFKKAAQCQMPEYCPVTFINYGLLLNKILSRHIKVLVMQYPLRNIGPLKDYLGQRVNVIYVENKTDFKEALAKRGYNYYFKDNFAYNFGHCTRAGNELIARHLAKIILKNE